MLELAGAVGCYTYLVIFTFIFLYGLHKDAPCYYRALITRTGLFGLQFGTQNRGVKFTLL